MKEVLYLQVINGEKVNKNYQYNFEQTAIVFLT